MERAVLQGEILSPKLFTIFMDDLVDMLHNSNIPALKVGAATIHLLLYADDIVLFSTNPIHLQEKKDLPKEYFELNGIKVNLGKTKVVIFRKDSRSKPSPVLKWGDTMIDIVDSYTYQGVPFSNNISKFYNDAIDHFLTKATVAEGSLHSLFYSSKMRTIDNRISLFNSLVRSVLLYCSPISKTDKLEAFYFNFVRRILGLPK